MKNKSVCLLAVAVLSLAGCATLHDAVYGRGNTLEPLATARLGATPRDEIIKRFGAPVEIDRRGFDAFEAEVFFYHEPYNGDGNRIEHRFLACEFSKGVLTAYAFRDSGASAQRSLDGAERRKLVKGESTRQEVEALLGIPGGRALLPTTITVPALDVKLGVAPFPLAKIPDEAKEAWQYHSQDFDDVSDKPGQKTLTVFFDAKGVLVGSALLQEQVVKSY